MKARIHDAWIQLEDKKSHLWESILFFLNPEERLYTYSGGPDVSIKGTVLLA